MIQINDINKKADQHWIMNRFQLTLPEAGIVGVIGANGSGKTTFFKLLTNLTIPTSGNILDTNTNQPPTLQTISFIPSLKVFLHLNIEELSHLYQQYYTDFDEKRLKYYLNQFQLNTTIPIQYLTNGQIAIVNVIMTISRNVQTYLLDEPFDGIDLIGREFLLDELLKLAVEQHKLVLISSHEIQEVERVIQSFIFIHQGDVSQLQQVEADSLYHWFIKKQGELRYGS